MTLLAISFIAGMLTVLAPCILPLLPVVIGSSAAGRNKATPYIVVGSLGVSIILFTFLLKASTVFITVPQAFWTGLSGGILVFFGLTLVFPTLWTKMPGVSRMNSGSSTFLSTSARKQNIWGDILVGAALGPVFSTCSPTYFVILASVLPASFLLGTTYLVVYVLGLSIILLLIGLLGQRFANTLAVAVDTHSNLKRALGALFILIGLAIAFGYEKKFETAILEGGYFDITKVEQKLLEQTEDTSTIDKGLDMQQQIKEVSDMPARYVEIVSPAGFLHTDGAPIMMSDYIGKRIILVDFLTYSCINCRRTLPHINEWYAKYKDQGLMVVGIHTPEFSFERERDNVEKALASLGVEFPVVLDNDYATWNAYGNRYWPHVYLIDLDGNIVYDHIGEGNYEETEAKIKELLPK